MHQKPTVKRYTSQDMHQKPTVRRYTSQDMGHVLTRMVSWRCNTRDVNWCSSPALTFRSCLLRLGLTGTGISDWASLERESPAGPHWNGNLRLGLTGTGISGWASLERESPAEKFGTWIHCVYTGRDFCRCNLYVLGGFCTHCSGCLADLWAPSLIGRLASVDVKQQKHTHGRSV